MAELTTEQVFNGDIAKVFHGIGQYARYPEFLPGVTGIKVLPPQAAGSVCQVTYELKLIKSFYYTLDMFEENPSRIWWNLAASNLMKRSNGSWLLSPAGAGKTKAVYTLDIGFSGLVPSKIVDQITKANLSGMMIGFQKLIDSSVSPQ